ncbi:MAG: hypothetical protein AAF439_12020 [Pseudomonadota bacterium]
MITIRRAGPESTAFCPRFFQQHASATEELGKELEGLAASFQTLSAYPTPPDNHQCRPCLTLVEGCLDG